MATVVTRTIGTASRDYSTLQSWEDAAPSNLVTSDQVWRGECYADTEFTAALTVSGSTVDSTRYKELTVAAGESFADHADKLTNALRYNASNGAALRSTTAWGTALTVSENYFRMSRLQVYQDSNNGNGVTLNNSNATVSDVIIESRGGRPLMLQSSSTLTNALVVGRKSSLSEVADIWNGSTVTNCTFAVPSNLTAATRVIKRSYWSGNTFVNCGFFGGTDAVSSATGATFTNCYTNDSTSIPSGCTTVAYDTSTGSGFENISNGTHDYRIKSTSALKDAGTSTGAPSVDIVGTSRPQGGLYDVGVWEFSSGAEFTFSGSGGLTFAGAATSQSTAAFSASGSGGLQFSGAATNAYTNSFSAAGSGGLSFGGAATGAYTTAWTAAGSGGLQFGGTADASAGSDYAVTGAGGITFAGAAAALNSADFSVSATGGLLFAGAAAAQVDAGFAATGSGGLLFGGAAGAVTSPTFAFSGGGGLLLGGDAAQAYTTVYSFTASGGMLLAGAATASMSTGGGTGATVDDIWNGILLEASLSPADMLRIILAAVSGKTTGIGSDTERYLSVDGSKARVAATFDGNGNRQAVTLDGSA